MFVSEKDRGTMMSQAPAAPIMVVNGGLVGIAREQTPPPQLTSIIGAAGACTWLTVPLSFPCRAISGGLEAYFWGLFYV